MAIRSIGAVGGGGGSVTSADFASLEARVSANSGTGGGGSVTSANFVSLGNRVSANSAQMSSADGALSAREDSLAASIAGALSAIAVNSAQMTSADGALSARADSLAASIAGALSAIAVNSAQMTSADGALSSRADSLAGSIAGAISLANDALSAARAASANITSVASNQISAANARIDSVASIASAAASAVNALSVVVSNRTSAIVANSAQMTSADGALSSRADSLANSVAGAISLANDALSAARAASANITSVLSNQISVIKADQVSLASDVGRLSLSVSQFGSAIPANSAQMTSADGALSARIDSVEAAGLVSAGPVKKILTGDQLVSGTAKVSVSGFQWAVSGGTRYQFAAEIWTSSPISTVCPQWYVSGPNEITKTWGIVAQNFAAPANLVGYANLPSNVFTPNFTTTSAVGASRATIFSGGFATSSSATGNVCLKVGNAVSGGAAGSSITLIAGSWGYLWRMG